MIHWIDFIAGWMGGVAGLIIGHPMDTIKTWQQTTGHSFSSTIREMYKYDGIMGCYKGFLIPFFMVGPSNALFFFGYAESLKLLQKKNNGDQLDWNDPNWKRNVALAGLISGTVQVIVSAPLEFVKILLQTANSRSVKHCGQNYKTAFEAIKGVYRTTGLLGFYRGFGPMYWRDGASSSIYMMVYESLRPRHAEGDNIWELITAGGLAGSISWSIIVPFDVIKTRLQTDNLLNPRYKGMIDCAAQMYRTEGLSIFAKGFWITTLRAFPVNAALFFVYELSLALLKNVFLK